MAMYPHRINLREPWQAIPEEHRTTYRRAFRWPTELMPFEQLWLVVGYSNTPIQLTLNQVPLGNQQPSRVPLELDISTYVQNQNLLEMVSLHDVARGNAKIQSVYLEVRRSVHLRDITGNCQWNNGKPFIELTASIRGQAERKLSMVVRLNDKEVCYRELELLDRPVSLKIESLDVPLWKPGQQNPLQALEVQLLDPSCVLAQQHYLTGFVDPRLTAGTPVESFPLDEPIFESTRLAEADHQGRLVRIDDVALSAQWNYLWHHPCIRAVS